MNYPSKFSTHSCGEVAIFGVFCGIWRQQFHLKVQVTALVVGDGDLLALAGALVL